MGTTCEESLVMERRVAFLFALLLFAVMASSACTYGRLLRPSVLKQLDPEMAELVNELPNVDAQNKEIIGRLFVHGGLSHAKESADGVMRDRIRIPAGEFIWKPAIIVMARPGELELDIANEDNFSHHAAILPSNGDKQFLMLPIHTRGKATVQLDGPGYYWFGCPVGNHAGRGMLGLIIVRGDVPDEARLDRPKQPRP
jgi:PQQ system protein